MKRFLPVSLVMALFFLSSCGGGGGGGGGDDVQFKGGATGALPAAPYGLSAAAVASGTVYLSWEAGSDEPMGYLVLRAASDTGTLYEVYRMSASYVAWHGTYHYDTALGIQPGTDYYYAVLAYLDPGSGDPADFVYSAVTERVPVTTPPAATSAPPAPTNLTLTPVDGRVMRLQWQDNGSGITQEDRFYIQEKSFNPYASTWYNWETRYPYPYPEETSWDTDVSSFSSGFIVRWRVGAWNSQQAPFTPSYSGSIEWAPGSAWSAAAPSGLIASAQSTSSIQVAWTDNTTDEDGFRVERTSGDSGVYAVAGTTSANQPTFLDTGLQGGSRYTYRVCAFKGSNYSAYSGTDSAATFAPVQFAPAAPTGVAAQRLSASEIRVSWTDASDNETGFKVFRTTTVGENEEAVKVLPANATFWADGGLAAATTYYYYLTAVNDAGESLLSNFASARTDALPTPAAPTGLGVSPASPTSMALTWTDASNNEAGFLIDRSTSASTGYARAGAVTVGVTTFTDTGLSPSTTYHYRVKAYNSSGESAYVQGSAATQAASTAPAAPTGLASVPHSPASISLSWAEDSTTETGFRVERSPTGTGSWTLASTTAPNATAYLDTGLSSNTVYYYRVRANGPTQNSDWSATASARTFAASQGIIRIANYTHWALVDARVNNVQTLGAGQYIPAGGTADLSCAPGTYPIALGVGTIDPSGTDVWFQFSGTVTVTNGGTQTVSVSVSIGELLTNFASYRDYVGEYWTQNNTIGWARYRFHSDGRWEFFDLVSANNWSRLGGGNVQVVTWNDYSSIVTFRTASNWPDVNFSYPFGSFMHRNGPASWPVITYVGQ